MTPELSHALSRYLRRPTPLHYLALRLQALSEPTYDPRSMMLVDVGAAFEARDFDAARAILDANMASWVLTPRAHRYYSIAAAHQGDSRLALVEKTLSQATLKGLVESGRGTESRPFLVSRTADEHDILKHFRQRGVSRQLVERGSRRLDVWFCEKGARLWFDVTDVVRRAEALTRAEVAARAAEEAAEEAADADDEEADEPSSSSGGAAG